MIIFQSHLLATFLDMVNTFANLAVESSAKAESQNFQNYVHDLSGFHKTY